MRNSIISGMLTILSFSICVGQKKDDRYAPDRLKKSVENFKIIEGNVFYEQRIYRNPFVGIFEARRIAAPDTSLAYVPLFQGMPVGKYEYNNEVRYSPLSRKELKDYFKSNRFPMHFNKYKLDFWIQPYFAAQFGNLDKPVESNTSVAIETKLYILPGLTFQTGILFPISNDLDGRPKNIRPSPTFLNQFYASGNNFLSASLGFFSNDQYGINVQYRHADLSKKWSYGLEAGMTGFYYYPKGGIYYEDIDQLLLLGDVAYRLDKHNITLKLSGGQFLWKDRGARFEMIRQFTNMEVGVYATKTVNGSTVGFNFAIPIPPGKILQGNNARLRTTDEFKWEYTYTRGYNIGERYRVGYQLDQKLRQYHQAYLNSQAKDL